MLIVIYNIVGQGLYIVTYVRRSFHLLYRFKIVYIKGEALKSVDDLLFLLIFTWGFSHHELAPVYSFS